MSGTPPARKNVRTRSFRDLFEPLPDRIKRLAAVAFRQFVNDPEHPGLRWHALEDRSRSSHRPGSFSVSITMQYRAIYVEDSDTNVWYWVGTHAEYDTFTGG